MPPTNAYGHNSYIIFGTKESTFDTWAAPTNGKKFRLLSWSPQPVIGWLPDESLHGQLSPKEPVQGLQFFRGTFTILLNYEGLLEFFRGAMGTYSNVVVEASLRDHLFAEASSATALGTVLNTYSGEVSWGNIPAGKVYRLTGVKFLGWSLKLTAGNGGEALGILTVSLWGRKIDTNADAGYDPTTSGVTEPAVYRVPFWHPWHMQDGSGAPFQNVRVRSVEVSCMPPHDEERAYLSSIYADEPLRSAPIRPTWRITQELLDAPYLLTDAPLGATAALRLIMQHPSTALAFRSSAACTPQNGNTITRASGSFVTDGWVVGNHVNASANKVDIPTGCYVTNVAALTLTVSGTTTLGASQTISGGTNREFEVRSTSAKLKSVSPPIEGYGPVVVTSEWEAFYNATDFASLLVRFRNPESALA